MLLPNKSFIRIALSDDKKGQGTCWLFRLAHICQIRSWHISMQCFGKRYFAVTALEPVWQQLSTQLVSGFCLGNVIKNTSCLGRHSIHLSGFSTWSEVDMNDSCVQMLAA